MQEDGEEPALAVLAVERHPEEMLKYKKWITVPNSRSQKISAWSVKQFGEL